MTSSAFGDDDIFFRIAKGSTESVETLHKTIVILYKLYQQSTEVREEQRPVFSQHISPLPTTKDSPYPADISRLLTRVVTRMFSLPMSISPYPS